MSGLGKLNLFLCGAVSLHAFQKIRKENHFKWSDNFQKHASCEEKSSLRLAMVYFRDGRRTPILKKIEVKEVEWPLEWVNEDLPHTMFDYEIKNARPFPSWIKSSLLDELYSNYGEFKGGAGHGMLTKFGQEDSFKLGQILRKRYIDREQLVSSNYSNDHVKSYTTFVKRTMDSLRCVLAAMFDNDSSEVATFYSRPNEFEYYYPNIEYCLRYNNIYHDALRLENRIFRFGYNRRKLAKMLGKNVEEMPDILKLWEEVYYLKNHGFELPENYTLAYSSIKKMASDIVEFRYFEFKKLEIKLAIGFMLDDINNAINTHISGDQSPSLYLHSVHDTTIIALMKGLDCYDGVWPEVSSYFAVELHNINTKWFVKFVYNDQPIHLKMTNDEFLPLHEFKSLIRKNQLGDVDFCKVCLTDNIQSHPNL